MLCRGKACSIRIWYVLCIYVQYPLLCIKLYRHYVGLDHMPRTSAPVSRLWLALGAFSAIVTFLGKTMKDQSKP